MNRAELAKLTHSKKHTDAKQEEPNKRQTVLGHLRDVADRIKDQITIIAVERGF